MNQAKQSVVTRVGEIAYVERGEGPVALFVHGVFLSSHLWRHVIDRLCDERRCVAIDLLSHGGSPAAPGQDISFRAQAEMLEAFCEAMGFGAVDLVANDSGGAIAQIFAVRHPERLRTLTLTNCDVHDNYPPAAFAGVRAAAEAGVFSAQREAYLTNPDTSRGGFSLAYEAVDQVADETILTYLGPLFASPQRTHDLERWLIASGDNSQTTEIAPLLRQLNTPTLIVWGTADPFFPLKWAYWLQGAIAGARPVVEVEGARLFFPEERPDALVEPLRRHWRTAPAMA